MLKFYSMHVRDTCDQGSTVKKNYGSLVTQEVQKRKFVLYNHGSFMTQDVQTKCKITKYSEG